MTRLRSTTAPPSLDLGDTLAYSRVSSDSQAREEKTSLADQVQATITLDVLTRRLTVVNYYQGATVDSTTFKAAT